MVCSSPAVKNMYSAIHMLTALLLGAGVFVGLPQRWWPVDVGAGLMVGLSLLASWSVHSPERDRFTRFACISHVVVSSVLLVALGSGAAFLAGVYGPLGKGGLIVFALVVALVLPYLFAAPLSELYWLKKRGR